MALDSRFKIMFTHKEEERDLFQCDGYRTREEDGLSSHDVRQMSKVQVPVFFFFPNDNIRNICCDDMLFG